MDADNSPAFEQACTAWIAQGVHYVVIDMSELNYVSSMGLRSFLSIAKVLNEKNGTLRLCGVSGLVRQVFEITRLSSVFSMHATLDSALAAP